MLLSGSHPTAGTRNRFATTAAQQGLAPLRRRPPSTLQVNLGKLCNQACRHCHVDAGPTRTEAMQRPAIDRVLALLAATPSLTGVDITGGAPELNPWFRHLVRSTRALGRDVTVRCNLTVLFEPDQEDTVAFYAAQRATIVASLPCYTAENVDRQRGGGVFEKSVRGLQQLNAAGYGVAEGAELPDALRLHLVYNPLGPSLPPPQAALEGDYRARLAADFGIRFDRLFAIANMPIHRFADDLARQGALGDYEDLLVGAFNADAYAAVMCRDLVSVDWDGRLSDCDFNQMLGHALGGRERTIFDVDDLSQLAGEPIATGSHCLGCSAGQGSSCAGATSPPSA